MREPLGRARWSDVMLKLSLPRMKSPSPSGPISNADRVRKGTPISMLMLDSLKIQRETTSKLTLSLLLAPSPTSKKAGSKLSKSVNKESVRWLKSASPKQRCHPACKEMRIKNLSRNLRQLHLNILSNLRLTSLRLLSR